MSVATRCGYVAIIGRPNVGKSTLLNRVLGQKISITSKKPQTTRHHLLGVKTSESCQVLYLDTPGLHSHEPRAINRLMNRAATTVARQADLIVFMLDRTAWTKEDEKVAQLIVEAKVPCIVVINKVDLVKQKPTLLPFLSKLSEKIPGAELVPISATSGDNVEHLEALIEARLPAGDFLYPEDQLTDRSERFLVSEIIREKIMRQLGEEVPYASTIQIDRFEVTEDLVHLDATVFVERGGQKQILIGRDGEKIKRIGIDARGDIESLLERQVMLNLWVKVRAGWSDDERALRSLGYDD